tara:strand:+ start:216 stop:350 length:135 start_codon:yes stop_codon:yes gene_type:complete
VQAADAAVEPAAGGGLRAAVVEQSFAAAVSLRTPLLDDYNKIAE